MRDLSRFREARREAQRQVMENVLSVDLTAEQIVNAVNGDMGGIIQDWVLAQVLERSEHVVLYYNRFANNTGRGWVFSC